MLKIELTEVVQGPGAGWHMSYGAINCGPTNCPPIAVAKGTTGSFQFHIAAPPGVTFTSANPLWIHAGNAKPTAPAVDVQFLPVSGAGTTTLSFGDTNVTAGDYPYSLHFSDGSTLDPIISNGGPGFMGGGGGTSGGTNIALFAVILIALVLLAYFGYRQFVKRPDTGVEPGSDSRDQQDRDINE